MMTWFFRLYIHVLQAFVQLSTVCGHIESTKLCNLAVHLMYNAVIETYKILSFVWKEKKSKKMNFIRGGRKLKGPNWGRVAEN